MRAICITTLLFFCSFIPAGNDVEQTYHFGKYSVIAGYCGKQSQITILESGTVVLKDCEGDGYYALIDTIYINNDGTPDYIFAYAMEEYYTLGMLVSDNKKYTKTIFGKEYTSPGAFSLDLALKRNIREVEFLLTDVDMDGRKDLVANLQYDGKAYKQIPSYTDTIYHKEILKLAGL